MNKISWVKVAAAMLLLAGMIVAITGCSEGSALLGRWERTEGGSVTMEFFKDGTGNINGTGSLKWKAEKGRLMISAYGSTETGDYKISGSTLTLTADDGKETQYKKVKK